MNYDKRYWNRAVSFYTELGLPWQWALVRTDLRSEPRLGGSGLQRGALGLLATVALTAFLLYPAYRERGAHLAENKRLMQETQEAIAAQQEDIDTLVATLQQLPPGRIYAGRGGNWGKEYTVGAIPVYALLNGAGLDVLGYLYHALSLNADVQVLFDETRPEQYDLFNVRYVVAPAGRAWPEFVQPIEDFGRHRLYQVKTTGYFDLVGSDMAFTGDKGDLYPAASLFLAGDFDKL